MADIDILTTDQPACWHQWLTQAGCDDIYFTPEYVQIFDAIEGGSAYLFVYAEGEQVFLYPFRLRPLPQIKALSDFAGWHDMTSDYGYGGPVVSAAQNAVGIQTFVTNAVRAFDRFCAERQIVSEFCRFHPLLKNVEHVRNAYQPIFCNQTVWIDLTLTEEECWRQIRKRYRENIRKAQKYEIVIEMSNQHDHAEIFYQLYTKTMEDVKANQYYFFDKEFFSNILKFLNNQSFVFLAYYQGQVIAASLFMWGKNFLHYFFAGMDHKYSYTEAHKFIVHYAILWGKKQGFKKLHVGGGVGGSDSDAVMFFKTGFSKFRSDFYIAKRIHHPAMYRRLCEAAQIDPATESFFPAYRAMLRK